MHASKWQYPRVVPIFGSAVAAGSLSWLYLLPTLPLIHANVATPYSTNAPAMRNAAKQSGLKTASDMQMIFLSVILATDASTPAI